LPSNDLGMMPMSLALAAPGGRRLGEIYEMSYAASLSALITSAQRLSSLPIPTVAMIVNPTADLDFTEIEGQIVATHFDPEKRLILLKDKATLPAVTQALPGRTYWHFASHGVFNWGNPRASQLTLHDNVPLTMDLIAKLPSESGVRLVVLSACETGLIDNARAPGALAGLPGAFLASGAAGVIGSLWQVDDRATALLMAKFYELHLAKGRTPSAALKEAQYWLRDATRGELLSFAQSLGGERRLDDAFLLQLQDGLQRGTPRVGKRFAAIWTRAQALTAEQSLSTEPIKDKSQADHERPYSHPYYWGGFVHMGL
jgi:CHAT domain-containing protein